MQPTEGTSTIPRYFIYEGKNYSSYMFQLSRDIDKLEEIAFNTVGCDIKTKHFDYIS